MYFVACSLASCNGQDYIGKLAEASSKIAQEQYDRGIGYINGYNDANAKLTKVTVYLKTNYQDVLNMTIVEKFLNDIQSHVTNNVQQLIDKYHPVVIFGYITYYFNNFIGNIVGNNATLSGITEVYQLYGAKFLQPKSGECMRDFDSQLVSVFLNASSGFIKNMTASTSSTGSQLDILRNDIETTITQLIKTLDGIIADKSTAGKQFEDFVSIKNFVVKLKFKK